MMDSTYTGAYGRLKGMRSDFLNPAFLEQLEQKEMADFISSLSLTSYRKEIDELSGVYKGTDLVEAVINAHMMRMAHAAATAIPPLAREIVSAFMTRWDIENIKTILSSKKLGYAVEHTQAFLTVQSGTPVGILAGLITREDYANMISQKDIEGVVTYAVKFGYGTPLLKNLDDARKGDISGMLLVLDLYYYTRLTESFKFYMGNEGMLLDYIRSSIDIKNIMSVIKAIEYGRSDIKEFIIKGGSIPESRLLEMLGRDVMQIQQIVPFNIGDAFELYREERFSSYIEAALKRELNKKYLKMFNESSISVEQIIGFLIRSEIERDEIRAVWLGKYYNIGKARLDRMKILKYVV
jgi:V/A-type H+-transporting ATPase subunit C